MSTFMGIFLPRSDPREGELAPGDKASPRPAPRNFPPLKRGRRPRRETGRCVATRETHRAVLLQLSLYTDLRSR